MRISPWILLPAVLAIAPSAGAQDNGIIPGFPLPSLGQQTPSPSPLEALGAQVDLVQDRRAATPLPQPEYTGPVGKVPIGYVASGTLNMHAISDYPGPWRGTLSHPVLTIDKREVLFPAGSTVVGRTIRVSGPNEAIHNRLGFVPEHIVRPDGQAFPIVDQAVLDAAGIGAIADEVDYHLGVQAAALGVFTAVEALPEILVDLADDTEATETLIRSTQSRGQAILQKFIALVPTISVRPGVHFRVFFSQELTVPIWGARQSFKYTTVKTE